MAGSQENVNVERWRPGFWRLFRQFASNVSEHHTLLAAAGVAYFFALALVPAVVTIVSIYGLVAEPYEVAEQLEPLTDALPDEAGKLVVTQLRGVTSIGEGRVGISLATHQPRCAAPLHTLLAPVHPEPRQSHEHICKHVRAHGLLDLHAG